MSAKKKAVPVIINETDDEIPSLPGTVYTAAEKKVLVNNYKAAVEQIRILEDQLSNAKQAKSDVCFEMQKAFGNKRFTIDGVEQQVISHKYAGKEETTYYLKSKTDEVITDHF
jgi:hypothetical protein